MPERIDESANERLRSRADLKQLLADAPLFSSLGDKALTELVDACEVVEVPGGTRLLRAGESLDALLGVLQGALRVVHHTDDGLVHTVRDFHRGETLGAMALLCERPVPVDLVAVRDSTLLRLSGERFATLARQHPRLLLAFARLMAERAFDVLETVVAAAQAKAPPRPGTLALLPLTVNAPVQQAAVSLVEVARAERNLAHVTADAVERALGPGAAISEGAESTRVTAWLCDQERAADVVLYECDPRLPSWTARCRRQSDRLVIVAAADESPERIRSVTAQTRPDGLARPIDLVLVHSSKTILPTGTRAYAALPDVVAIHHVREGRRDDLARTVRRIRGRPVGLVLSGGGARGIAHVGVIAAIVEAGIPIDTIGGTSMGALFGASLAEGFDVAHMRREVRELFSRPFALYDLTIPISSLLAGKKLNHVLHEQLGDADIEDLWRPFFCVSTDLSRANLVVHDRGCLWRSVRASVSIPGIFPPLPWNGRTLVDGGLVDNLPIDLMLERCAGPIIAVDVFPYGDPGFEQPSGRLARWIRALRSRIREERASPPLFDILVRSTLVGSKVRQDAALTREAQVVYLEPPVASFGPLEWRSHRALFEAGYRHAARELERHHELFSRISA